MIMDKSNHCDFSNIHTGNWLTLKNGSLETLWRIERGLIREGDLFKLVDKERKNYTKEFEMSRNFLK